MTTSSVVAARLDPEVKRQTQNVLKQEHLTDSAFIRRMYAYVASTGKLPDFVLNVEYDGVRHSSLPDKFDNLRTWIRDSPYSSKDFSFLTDESVEQTLGSGEDEW